MVLLRNNTGCLVCLLDETEWKIGDWDCWLGMEIWRLGEMMSPCQSFCCLCWGSGGLWIVVVLGARLGPMS